MRHMNTFLLASKKLTTAGHGKTPYEYFEIFLETLKGFPAVGQRLPAYYAVNTTMATRTLSTLYPYLKSQLEFLLVAGSICGLTVLRCRDPCPKTQEQEQEEEGS
jgi:hypothetical protein